MAHEDRPFGKPIERLLNAELVESYRPGGLHPVNIGDTFKDGRYTIVRKLGHGSSSTVWLAEDTLAQDTSDARYVAIKIIGSEASKASKESVINRRISANKAARGHVVTLLDSFKHLGPNGEHDCLVFEPMGPDVTACFERAIPHWQGRLIGKQLLTALQCLHDLEIAYSDINPGNLLLSLTYPIGKQFQSGNSMSTRIEGKRNSCAPEHIYEDQPLIEFWDHMAPELKLSDFGAAFPINDPPKRPIIAVALRAPEVVLQSSFDHRVDIWSFGFLLFEFFTGQPLFELLPFNPARIDADHLQQIEMKDDDHLLQMIRTLGPLPSAMFQAWPRRMDYFDGNLKAMRTDVGKSENPLSAIYVGDMLMQRVQKRWPMGMTAKEGADLVHVLRSALQYDPAKRPSATDLLSLDWFQCT